MKNKKINEEYFDSEDLKGKEEINFLKGKTKDELKKIISKKDKDPKSKMVERIGTNLFFKNPFLKNFKMLFGRLSGKDVINIIKKIDVNDDRFSAVSSIKMTITINKDESFSVYNTCEVKVNDTKGKDNEYKMVFENFLNVNAKDIEELNKIFSNEIYSFVKRWDNWSYSVTGKNTLNNKEVEFKDDMVKDKFKGGSFKMEVDPNFNPQFNSKSYVLKDYEKFIKEDSSSGNDKPLMKFNKNDLFEAFSYYAFTSTSNQPYNKEELKEEFEKWFNGKFK